MLLTVLLLDENPRLQWRKVATEYFQETGDWTVYSLFPCIILKEGDYFDKDQEIGNGRYTLSQKASWNGKFSTLPVIGGTLPHYAENAGLFISQMEDKSGYPFPEIETGVSSVALIELRDESFRILRSRRLRKDRES